MVHVDTVWGSGCKVPRISCGPTALDGRECPFNCQFRPRGPFSSLRMVGVARDERSVHPSMSPKGCEADDVRVCHTRVVVDAMWIILVHVLFVP